MNLENMQSAEQANEEIAKVIISARENVGQTPNLSVEQVKSQLDSGDYSLLDEALKLNITDLEPTVVVDLIEAAEYVRKENGASERPFVRRTSLSRRCSKIIKQICCPNFQLRKSVG